MRKEIFARCLADERLAGPIGRYGISLTCKAAHVMDSRRLTLYIQGWLGWVEDAIHVVIDQLLFGDGRVSDFFRYAYPEDFPAEDRCTRIKDERRTLLFRIRHMLRALAGVAKHYEYFEQWKFTGIEFAMDQLENIIQQVIGGYAYERFRAFYRRFHAIWAAVNPALDNEDSIRAELLDLVDESCAVFEALADAMRQIEAKEGAASEIAEATVAIRECAEGQREATRVAKRALVVAEKVAGLAAQREPGEDDIYGRMAGLERYNEAKRCEIAAAIKMSHRDYPVVKGASSHTAPTLGKLAERCWRANRERFEELAKLKLEPGYKNVATFKSALYDLARRYPAADHFVWQP